MTLKSQKIIFVLTLIAVAGLTRYSTLFRINRDLTDSDATKWDSQLSHHSYFKEKISPSNNPSIPSSKSNNTDVIVYLAQFGDHSSYGKQTDGKNEITGASKLNDSLTTLYKNYVNDFPCDVIVFYSEGDDPNPELLKRLKKNRSRLHFEQLDGPWWSLPPGLSEKGMRKWKLPGFSVGYRHMIRWYSKLIWLYLDGIGYTHVMRMDDDSYLHSKIKYNLFHFMRKHKKRYAFRQPCTDTIGIGPLNDLVDGFLNNHPNFSSAELVEEYHQHRSLGFYNNWFMADISLFLSPVVSEFIDVIDNAHVIYTHRTNDLLIQSVAVRLFLKTNEIQWFQDFSYQHVTLSQKNGVTCPSVGALTRGEGTDIMEWKRITDEFLSRVGSNCKIFTTVRKDDRMGNGTYDCVGSKLCLMESLGSEEGHYLYKIANNN